MTTKYTFKINLTVKIISREGWKKNSHSENKFGRNVWYIDRSKTEHGTGFGIYCKGRILKYLPRFTREIYSILQYEEIK